MSKINAKMTDKRRAWLTQLRDEGPSISGSPVGHACRVLGWSEWYIRLKDGRKMPMSEAERELGDRPWEHFDRQPDGWPECITEAGREALKTL